MKSDVHRIFKRLYGCDASDVTSCAIEKGSENRGIFLHCASNSAQACHRVLKLIEKKTARRSEIRISHTLKKIQNQRWECKVFPRIYLIKPRKKVTSVFMDYVEGVDDIFLREERSVELIVAALSELNRISHKDLSCPRKINFILSSYLEILSILPFVDLTWGEKWSLLKLMIVSISALVRLPMVLSHGDLSFQNMAYNKYTHEVRFIDFGLIHCNFAGSDLKNLFRCRELLQYDFYKLTYKYALISGYRQQDLMLSVWFADLRRCTSRIIRARRREIPSALDRETKALRLILDEFKLKL